MILDITSADGAFRENITQRTKGKVSVYVIFTKLKLTIQSIMNSFSDNCSTVIHCRCHIRVACRHVVNMAAKSRMQPLGQDAHVHHAHHGHLAST